MSANLLGDQSEGNELADVDAKARPGRKWRIVSHAYSGIRALQSSVSQVLDNKKSDAATSGGSTSYASIEGGPESPGFAIDKETLDRLVNDKNIGDLQEFGGVDGVAKALKTSLEHGLYHDDIASRCEAFGTNSFETLRNRSFFHFVWRAILDRSIVILIACGAVTLGFGLKVDGLKDSWTDWGSIFLGVFFAVIVFAISDHWQSRLLVKLHRRSKNIQIDVVRGGRHRQIPVMEIVVGDVVCLKPGDRVPAHGLLSKAHSLKLESVEASINVEGDHIELNLFNEDTFLFSGTKVVNGFAQMLVTSVGMNAKCGETITEASNDCRAHTSLQLEARLEKLDLVTDMVGYALSLVALVVMLSLISSSTITDENDEELHGLAKAKAIVDIVVGIITTVINIPDPWKMSLILTHAYAMKKMMANKAMVLKSSALETLGSSTTICTRKTDIIMVNQMKVTKYWLVGKEIVEEEAYLSIPPHVVKLFGEGIALNTTGAVYGHTLGSESEISCSPTEKAILLWAVEDMKINMKEVRRSHDILQIEAFKSETKRSGILTKRKADSTVHVHWKGAAELILAMCSRYYDASGNVQSLDEKQKTELEKVIEGMAASSLSCIGFAHEQVAVEEQEIDKVEMQNQRLILLGVVGITNPFQTRMKDIVEDCHNAGVKIKMITGDNLFTAKAIATECGILSPDNGMVIEGKDFQNYSLEERMNHIDKICVMARSSPSDRLLMIHCLKEKGHVIALTGDGTNDASAMEKADIGIYMGLQDTEVTEKSSNIVISDGNFASIPKLLRWGRCVCSNIRKLIQFQLTATFASLVANFVGSISGQQLPLTTTQLLWVSLVTDTLGTIALSMEKPTKEVMEKPPMQETDPLITNIMLRNILPQTLYQIALLLTIHFKGKSIFSLNDDVKVTFLFNSYVLCQVFNQLNARTLEKKNVFGNIHRNKLFLAIIAVTVALQILLVEILKKFADTERLNWSQWGQCIAAAALTLPIGWIARCTPVPEREIFSHPIVNKLNEYTEMDILRKMRSLSTWTYQGLVGMRGNWRLRRFLRISSHARVAEE
ncbi:hypothetical protein TIFTF001_015976 [Ficus carica]|uniref:Calcium-transporting ATPase n=1 Tax=Ficus carica TaxID=3494 RepID=A0AA88ASU4_FICCA|nr:hypothetical protein TIFTF001_015976 [Ficus carica]